MPPTTQVEFLVLARRGIVHGGMSAMIVDEALGVLVHVLMLHGVLPPGPAFTAHLGVDYKKVIAVLSCLRHALWPPLGCCCHLLATCAWH